MQSFPMMLLFLTILVISGCSSNNWMGFYYSDKDNIGDESTWTIKSDFISLEECKNWINDVAGNNTNYDYECGYKCKYKDDYGIYTCKETVK